MKVSYKDNFSMFGVKRFTSESDKADIFPGDIHLSILKEQLTQIFGHWLCLELDSVKHSLDSESIRSH